MREPGLLCAFKDMSARDEMYHLLRFHSFALITCSAPRSSFSRYTVELAIAAICLSSLLDWLPFKPSVMRK